MNNASALLPFVLFAIVMTGTPGPNNAMVTASAARVGALRTMPLVSGITVGVAVMFIAMAFGLGAVLTRFPVLDVLMRILATALLVWIAWKILTAGPVSDDDEQPLLGFFGGAGFQWLNPKAWAMTGSAATVYLPASAGTFDIGLHALILWTAGICLVTLWALLGELLRRPLRSLRFARWFNAVMALLLMAATLPMMIQGLSPASL